MRVTDPIADLLVRLKNAGLARRPYAIIPASMLKVQLVNLLSTEGFVGSFRLIKDSHQGKIKVALKYDERGLPCFRGSSRISRPGRRVFLPARALSKLARESSAQTHVVSTPRGILTGSSALAQNVGGELMFKVW